MVLTIIAAATLAANAFAAPADLTGTGLMTPAVREGLAAIKAAMPKWTPVYMSVRGGTFLGVNENSLRISLSGSAYGNGGGSLSGTVGQDYLHISASASPRRSDGSRSYNLFGSGISLSVNGWGTGYQVFGSVGTKSVSFNIDRFGSGYSLFGLNGANVSVFGMSPNLYVNGQIDPARCDAKTLAALGAVLAFIDAK
jgi:hypothetical protein